MSTSSFGRGISQDLLAELDSDNGGKKAQNEASHEVQKLLVQELKSRDTRIATLNGDKVKLKNLLRKAKGAIDSINGKYKASQE